MFSGNRKFNGRQGEQILNEEMYVLYEILKHFLDIPPNPEPNSGPSTGLEKPGALWLDRQTSPGNGHVMYHDVDGRWKPLFEDWFKIIKDIRHLNGEPENPKEGQLWINDSGVLMWYNGFAFEPIKSSMADIVDFDANAFQNFLMIDPMKMTGGYIIENISNLVQLAGGILEYKPNHLYNKDDLFFYTFEDGKSKFFKVVEQHMSLEDFILEVNSAKVKEIDLKAQYLIPSEYLDKIFIDGNYAEKENDADSIYEKVTDVCIQISLSVYNGKAISAVHVNPIALKNIRKKIVRIEKDPNKFNDYGVVKVGPENTEYYGFKGSYGRLLIRGHDYVVKTNGIQLTRTISSEQALINRCDFDEDGIITEVDLAMITSFIGSRDPEIISIFDLNNDGIIDEADRLIVNSFLGKMTDSGSNFTVDYDFVYCLTYDFETRIKSKGILYKDTINLNNRSSIWIGELNPNDKLMIFSGGLCLEDFYYEYNATSETVDFSGYDKNGNLTNNPDEIEKSLFGNTMNLAIFRFFKKTNVGIFTDTTLSNNIVDEHETQLHSTTTQNGKAVYVVKLPVPRDYVHPMVFVQGLNLDFSLKDYEIINNEIIITDAMPGKAYYIVDTVREDGFNMFIRSGVVDNSCTIKINDDDILSGECSPILFVNGIYISTRDIYFSDSNTITINDLVEGQEYILLKDKDDKYKQLLYDDLVSFSTIRFDSQIDDAVVYVNNRLIMDATACTSTIENTTGQAHNEIKFMPNNKWCYFDSTYKTELVEGRWIVIEDETLNVSLDIACSGYSVDNNLIHILQNFGTKNCTYYAYKFADRIEKPLIKGYSNECIDLGDEIFYKLNRNHSYTPNTNALSVWINGIKQSVVEDKIPQVVNGVTKIYQGYKVLKSSIDIPIAFKSKIKNQMLDVDGNITESSTESWPTSYYVIEEKEQGENRSCNKELITATSSKSTFNTVDVLLTSGIPKIYIDGYRQPIDSFIVNNMNTFTLLEPIICIGNSNMVIEDKNGDTQIYQPMYKSKIEIETRQDYTIKEKTVVLTEQSISIMKKGSVIVLDVGVAFKNSETLPLELFLSQTSEINIFINGANYGDMFYKMKNQDVLVLSNKEVIDLLKPNDTITIEWR